MQVAATNRESVQRRRRRLLPSDLKRDDINDDLSPTVSAAADWVDSNKRSQYKNNNAVVERRDHQERRDDGSGPSRAAKNNTGKWNESTSTLSPPSFFDEDCFRRLIKVLFYLALKKGVRPIWLFLTFNALWSMQDFSKTSQENNREHIMMYGSPESIDIRKK